MSTEVPFRSPDLAARVAALRERRDALAGELARVEAELRVRHPWSWLRFGLAASLPLVLVVISMVVQAIVLR
jgi:hypothetical protein